MIQGFWLQARLALAMLWGAALVLCTMALPAAAQQRFNQAAAQEGCTLPRVDRRTEVVAALFLDPPSSTEPEIVGVGFPGQEVALLLTSAYPRPIRIEATPGTTIVGVFFNGPEGTRIEGLPETVDVLRHVAGQPVPECDELGLPKLANPDAQRANLDTQRIGLTLFRRPPDRTLRAEPGRPLVLGETPQTGQDTGDAGGVVLNLLADTEVQEGYAAYLQMRDGMEGAEIAPPVQGCRLPNVPANAHVSLIAVGETRLSPLNPLPGDDEDMRRGEPRGRVDVQVLETGRPTVLILNAYQPTEWLVGLAEGAEVAGVVLSGFGRQKLTGLPGDLPVLIHTAAQFNAACWDGGLGPRVILDEARDAQHGLALAQATVGQAADLVQVVENAQTVTSTGTDPISVWDLRFSAERGGVYERTRVPPGRVGLEYLRRRQAIRDATQNEITSWYSIADPEATQDARLAVTERNLHYGNAIMVLSTVRNLPRGIGVDDATYLLNFGVNEPAEGGWEATELYVLRGGLCLSGPNGGVDCDCLDGGVRMTRRERAERCTPRW